MPSQSRVDMVRLVRIAGDRARSHARNKLRSLSLLQCRPDRSTGKDCQEYSELSNSLILCFFARRGFANRRSEYSGTRNINRKPPLRIFAGSDVFRRLFLDVMIGLRRQSIVSTAATQQHPRPHIQSLHPRHMPSPSRTSLTTPSAAPASGRPARPAMQEPRMPPPL